jgi:hypothetical protein
LAYALDATYSNLKKYVEGNFFDEETDVSTKLTSNFVSSFIEKDTANYISNSFLTNMENRFNIDKLNFRIPKIIYDFGVEYESNNEKKRGEWQLQIPQQDLTFATITSLSHFELTSNYKQSVVCVNTRKGTSDEIARRNLKDNLKDNVNSKNTLVNFWKQQKNDDMELENCGISDLLYTIASAAKEMSTPNHVNELDVYLRKTDSARVAHPHTSSNIDTRCSKVSSM